MAARKTIPSDKVMATAVAKEMTASNLSAITFDQNKPAAVVEFFIKLGVDKYHSSFFSRIW
jgi:hypothetical protein